MEKCREENTIDHRYLDSSLSANERAECLLKQMTVAEKMAQTIGVFMNATLDDKVKSACKNGMGEVSTLDARTMRDPHMVARLQHDLQSFIMQQSRFQIPAIFHMEGLCGAFIQDSESFPSGIGRGSSFDPALEERVGAIVARQERAFGITHTFAPVLDINRDSRLGRQGETYGEDPTLTAAMGTAYTKGIQGGETKGTRSEAVAKHFLGFHNSEAGIHGAVSNTPERMLREIYGKPFQAAIAEAHLRGVMPCYCTINGEAASVSKHLLTTILRDEMGFDGLVPSDYGAIANTHRYQMQYENETETGYRSMKAGMDMELPDRSCYSAELETEFEEGKRPMEVLDTAVLRILEAKFRMGLFEHPYALEGEALEAEFHQEEDDQVSQKMAEESLVLLKNDGVLPLKKNLKKVVVIGPHAMNARSFFGGYTHMSMAEAVKAVANSIAGIGEKANNETKMVHYIPGTEIQSDESEEFDELLREIKPACKNLFQVLQEHMKDTELVYSYGYPVAGNDTSQFEQALAAMEGADAVILTLGGKHGSCSIASMGEGVDATNINLPECQDAFILEAAKKKIPLIGIHFNGRPISSDIADQHLSAMLEAWNPAEHGALAIVKTLLGEINPSGKLPTSVAYHAGQIPVYYNHPNGSSTHQGESIGFANYVDLPHAPRYPFGYGLSYTTFVYRDLTLSKKDIQDGDKVTIRFTLQNTGSVKGTEVVQLYFRDCFASMVRPCMELAGFKRVTLEAGEEKEVTFSFDPSQTAFLDEDMRWKVEAGDVELMVGSSSTELPLHDFITITKDCFIDGSHRAFYAK